MVPLRDFLLDHIPKTTVGAYTLLGIPIFLLNLVKQGVNFTEAKQILRNERIETFCRHHRPYAPSIYSLTVNVEAYIPKSTKWSIRKQFARTIGIALFLVSLLCWRYVLCIAENCFMFCMIRTLDNCISKRGTQWYCV